MQLNLILCSTVLCGLLACKPASFKNVEVDEGTDNPAAAVAGESQDAVASDPTGGVVEEVISSAEVSTIEIKLQPPDKESAPVIPKPKPDDLKIACVDAKNNGTLKTKVIPLLFPARTATCDFGKNDNLSRVNEVIRARREESLELPLDGMTRLCNMKFDAAKQNMRFDDEILITLNQLVVAASQDYSIKSKDIHDQQVYANGFAVDSDGLVTYKWLPPNGLQNLNYYNGKLSRYCLGLDPKSPTFDQTCQIPQTSTTGSMQLILPQDAFLKLAVKAGLVFDKQIQQLPKATLGFITSGDDDDSDCQHLDFRMTVTVDYLP